MKGGPAAGAGRGTRLSALVVNYESGAFCVRCVESLAACWALDGRAPEDLEVVVVDNASPSDQETWLRAVEELGATVVRHTRNDGYAAGMNLALARTSGGPDDVVAVLNPDLFFPPGSLAPLLDYLAAHPECGAVGPRAFIDPGGVLHLPRNTLPTVADAVRVLFAQASPALCRAYSRRRTRLALPWWTAPEPFVAEMLSGCCMLLRRGAVDRLPALMDERYPLYFEDTDLCRELQRRGLEVVFHPGSEIVHHWSRSAGPTVGAAGEPMRRHLVARAAYFEKFHGKLGRAAVDAVAWASKRWPAARSFRPMHEIVDLGDFAGPAEIPLPRRCSYLMELTMAPSWVLAVGIFDEGDRWVCPAGAWEWFFQGQYYMRALDLATHEVLGAWSFRKVTPGRDTPLELRDFPEYAGVTPRVGAADRPAGDREGAA